LRAQASPAARFVRPHLGLAILKDDADETEEDLTSGGPGLRSGQSGEELVLAKAFSAF